jgi:predicted nucleic acid-binding protein
MTLLDTGPLVAALDAGDEWHGWASERMRQLSSPVRTCGAVLSETAFLVRSHPRALDRLESLLSAGIILSLEEDGAFWNRAVALMKQYANVPMGFADACLVAAAETIPVAKIFTLDRDFLIYRQENDKPLTLIAPFVG